MKKIRIQILLILVFFSCEANAQRFGKEYLFSKIKNSFLRTTQTYNNNFSLFFNFVENFELINYKEYNLGFHNQYYKFYELEVLIDCSFYSPDITDKCDTLKFSFLNVAGVLYKAFGFYNSDILNLKNQCSKKEITFFIKKMIENNILTKKEAFFYKKAILNERYYIPKIVNKPSGFLKIYFGDNTKNTRTILLRSLPLKEFSF